MHCGNTLRQALELHDPGDLIGNYRVLRMIGHGGFGAVYAVESLQQPGSHFALKEMFDPASLRAGQNEFTILQSLTHDNLPRYYEWFEQQGNGYLVMELVEGQNLEEILLRRRGPLPEPQVLGYALQLCEVLRYLHTQPSPILHRDLKPANIRLTHDGLIKLVDFGLLKQGTQTTRITVRGVGTPAYAPIEQYGGDQHTEPGSDLYSLGATLYHLLSGQEPTAAGKRLGTVDPLPPLSQVNPAVAAAVTRAMSPRLDQRYPDIISFKGALLDTTPAVDPVLPPPPSSPLVVKRPIPLAIFLGAGASLMALIAVLALAFAPSPPPPPPITQPPIVTPVTVTVQPIPPALPTWVPELVKVSTGPFLMGSTDQQVATAVSQGANADWVQYEKPQHMLTLPDYWIGKTEVTNAQFRPFVEGDGYTNPGYWTAAGWTWRQENTITQPEYWNEPQWNAPDYPVVGVSWFEAVAYCRWLSKQTGLAFRLPSEAEWEKAARGTNGRIYPWGNSWETGRANSSEAGLNQTTPVGTYPTGASPFGVLDMVGNVREWCATEWGKPYPYQLEDEWQTAYLETDTIRVLRGGAYWNDSASVRGAYRLNNSDDPRARAYRGLRIASHASVP